MNSKKIIVLFEAGRGLAQEDLAALQDAARAQLNLPDAETRFIPAIEWDAVGVFSENDLENPARKAELLQKQRDYLTSRRWELTPQALAGGFRDLMVNPALGSLFFLYAFDRMKIIDAEARAERLYTAWVPAKKYRRPALVLGIIALLLAGVPITFSLIYPDFLGAGWAILDLAALAGAGVLAWRGVVRRLRRYPVHHREHCGGCGHSNAHTSVVTFNCEKCGKDLAYELAADPAARGQRIQQVKCPYCDGVNDLRFRRVVFTCTRCQVRQPARHPITD